MANINRAAGIDKSKNLQSAKEKLSKSQPALYLTQSFIIANDKSFTNKESFRRQFNAVHLHLQLTLW